MWFFGLICCTEMKQRRLAHNWISLDPLISMDKLCSHRNETFEPQMLLWLIADYQASIFLTNRTQNEKKKKLFYLGVENALLLDLLCGWYVWPGVTSDPRRWLVVRGIWQLQPVLKGADELVHMLLTHGIQNILPAASLFWNLYKL